ncbi:stage III sporulation protein AA [Alkalihalobacillus alcalophilus ATCC 27647 = CGMCC 1.3604]|uniref:Stage III sporulation protein AA n=1 Tax=Alkalihalobacillus alcalophilus ATCC 27647 = CGMCC 1.3604 TaxID=1218173 RepID=A0A094XGL1_ALKAL|nr:stage III sporulation protein AA [Alkalihalobacillus alcalophilus]KGA97910.1 stage III sporulation protein AA [Alkalihalobacillus alcalophilus ATCC 27647 = CGMCC 1.3604]MED1561470.1 stage III sporulation protein AA [Alkalihalobacillus alcalophilus]THG88408.1 stage III sporulation protein AA [Alkalihalobacillus alcalophilus ATCC 27647 = CGMCC 1.3604]
MKPEIMAVLPESIRTLIKSMPSSLIDKVEEIRVRVGRPLEVIAEGRPFYPENDNHMYRIRPEDGQFILNQLSHYSFYAFEEELKRGYITIRGGHRVGLSGKVILEKGQVKTLKEISSYNIRVARQTIGVADKLISQIFEKEWLNTLIIGPPQTGKTTLLRDIARLISEGDRKKGIQPLKVGIVDERSEIAASVKGVPQHRLGDRVDVLDGCPKVEGMMMLIRTMSPDVIIVDEIGREEDRIAIEEAMYAGVKVITTAHGHSVHDLKRRPALKGLIELGVFERFIELTKSTKPGVIRRVERFQWQEGRGIR